MDIQPSFPGKAKALTCNAYETLWNRYEQEGWPDDHIIHIEGVSGKKRTYREFHTRVVLAATALGTPDSDGSLRLGNEAANAEMIAIIGHNSSVREVPLH